MKSQWNRDEPRTGKRDRPARTERRHIKGKQSTATIALKITPSNRTMSSINKMEILGLCDGNKMSPEAMSKAGFHSDNFVNPRARVVRFGLDPRSLSTDNGVALGNDVSSPIIIDNDDNKSDTSDDTLPALEAYSNATALFHKRYREDPPSPRFSRQSPDPDYAQSQTMSFDQRTAVEVANKEVENNRWNDAPVDPLSPQAQRLIPYLTRTTRIAVWKFETRRTDAFNWPVVRWFIKIYLDDGTKKQFSITDNKLADDQRLDVLLNAIWRYHSQGSHRWMPNNSEIMRGKPSWTENNFFKKLYPVVQCMHL